MITQYFFIKKYVSYTIGHEFRSCWYVHRSRRAYFSRRRGVYYKITPWANLVRIGGRYMDFACPSCGSVSHIQYPYPRLSLYTQDA